jgi:band 4.1-like protein 1/2/3
MIIIVEQSIFVRLRRPDETPKRTIIPRFNSTFRYTGTYTYHQARQVLLDRPNPDFERYSSKRMSRSLHAGTIEYVR